MLPLLREMRAAVNVPLAAQPAAFRTTDECHSFTRLPEFPDSLESIQIPRQAFTEFGRIASERGHRIRRRLLRLQRGVHPIPRAGRQNMIAFDDSLRAQFLIGVDVGGTKCAAGLILLPEGGVLARRLQPTQPNRGGPAVLADVIELVRSLQREAAELDVEPTAIGLGVAELVGVDRQILSDATIHWQDAHVDEALRAATGLTSVRRGRRSRRSPGGSTSGRRPSVSFLPLYHGRNRHQRLPGARPRALRRRAWPNWHFRQQPRLDSGRRRPIGIRTAFGAVCRRAGRGHALRGGSSRIRRHRPRCPVAGGCWAMYSPARS